jgi:hypothetical protein
MGIGTLTIKNGDIAGAFLLYLKETLDNPVITIQTKENPNQLEDIVIRWSKEYPNRGLPYHKELIQIDVYFTSDIEKQKLYIWWNNISMGELREVGYKVDLHDPNCFEEALKLALEYILINVESIERTYGSIKSS